MREDVKDFQDEEVRYPLKVGKVDHFLIVFNPHSKSQGERLT